MVKLAIFDLDGTLVNSLEDLACAVNYALELHGFPIHTDVEKFKYFIGDGRFELIRRALPEEFRDGDDTVNMLKPDFDKYYSENYDKNTNAYDGITELVKNLKNNGVKLAVATNKPDEFAKCIVSEQFGDLFDYVKGFTDNMPKKPSPDIVYYILDMLDTDGLDAIFIGDSNVDMFTAKNSGLKSIGCLWGYRTKEELLSAGADYIANTPSDILNILIKEHDYEL